MTATKQKMHTTALRPATTISLLHHRAVSQRQLLAINLRSLRTLAGVLGEKIRMRAILKENTANYISLESLINVDFGKNINCRFLQFRKRKSQVTPKMTMCHSIELIGYQIQALGKITAQC